MTDSLQPSTPEELCDIVANAAQAGSKLRVRGGGSKDDIGAPAPDVTTLEMSVFSGVIDYDPPELVLTAQAATPLAEIERLVAGEGQMLAFEPFDHGPILGNSDSTATIGGIVAAAVAGPRRLSAGGTRDHVLGFEAVSGDGELFKAGSRVVKNVTGFDLSKLVAGSWGRLVALTQVTLKVLPRPEAQQTVALRGLGPESAIAVMAQALGSPAGVAAAAHLPQWEGQPTTLFRIEGFPISVKDRLGTLESLIGEHGVSERLDPAVGEELWQNVQYAALLPPGRPLWRVVTAPGRATALLDALDQAEWLWDWAGGLTWVSTDMDPGELRDAVVATGGHATLIRGDVETRTGNTAFHPPAAAVAAMENSIRRAFDPAQVFDFGRF
jgi:glycolate oxidase FAD binding subunit